MGRRPVMSKLFITSDDLSSVFDPVEDNDQINISDVEIDITKPEYIQNLYSRVFGEDEQITEKELKIISTFSIEKSFERAVALCHKMISAYDPANDEDVIKESEEDVEHFSDCCDDSTKLIIDCHNNLIEKRVPHVYKAGMLLISILKKKR
jgi:viroplasmin and RNaseH domain-containing protein